MALISLQLVVGNVPEKGNANQDGIRIIEIMDSESKIDVAKWNPRNKEANGIMCKWGWGFVAQWVCSAHPPSISQSLIFDSAGRIRTWTGELGLPSLPTQKQWNLNSLQPCKSSPTHIHWAPFISPFSNIDSPLAAMVNVWPSQNWGLDLPNLDESDTARSRNIGACKPATPHVQWLARLQLIVSLDIPDTPQTLQRARRIQGLAGIYFGRSSLVIRMI